LSSEASDVPVRCASDLPKGSARIVGRNFPHQASDVPVRHSASDVSKGSGRILGSRAFAKRSIILRNSVKASAEAFESSVLSKESLKIGHASTSGSQRDWRGPKILKRVSTSTKTNDEQRSPRSPKRNVRRQDFNSN
jgi:hypothetical protein